MDLCRLDPSLGPKDGRGPVRSFPSAYSRVSGRGPYDPQTENV